MTNTFSMSTESGTSTGVAVDTSTNDESWSTSTTVDITTQTSSPDGSDGLAAAVGGEAIAVGEDTLATGSISGTLIDSGAVTSAELLATMVAASESPDGETAVAVTGTYADVSDGAETVFSYTVNTQNSTQDATGSTATSTSTTNLVAYDIQPNTVINTTGSATEDDSSGTDDQPESSPTPTDVEGEWELDGNFASLEVSGLAAGEETLVEVDANVLVIEDELSVSWVDAVLAVD